MKFRFLVLSLLLLLIVQHIPGRAQSPTIPLVPAPGLGHCDVINDADFGEWDDVHLCKENDTIILRRADKLFSLPLPLSVSTSPKELLTLPPATTSIVSSAVSGNLHWLFMESSEEEPFALEINSGNLIRFTVPRTGEIIKNRRASFRVHLIPHRHGAFLSVGGGEPESWPREGNHAVFFWMSLTSGKVISLPVGWDLNYYSADQRLAVFQKYVDEKSGRGVMQSIDIESGRLMEEIPNARVGNGVVQYDWQYTQTVHPLYVRSGVGDEDHFCGLTFGGEIFPIIPGLGRTDRTMYLSKAKIAQGFAGFNLRPEGSSVMEAGLFWMMSLRPDSTPRLIGNKITDFSMLNRGGCVFKTTKEAFFFSYPNTLWSVTDKIDFLPTLGKEFIGKDYIKDTMHIGLIEGFDKEDSGFLALCLFMQQREDIRSSGNLNFTHSDRVSLEQRRGAVVVTANGERYLIDPFRDRKHPSSIWLHNSGQIITYGGINDSQKGLHAVTLRFPGGR